MKVIASSQHKQGYLLMEVVLALLLFSVMAVSYTRTLAGIRRNSMEIENQMQIAQILDSALREAMTFPLIEEGETIVESDEREMQLLTRIEPMELLNEDGEILSNMFRVMVTATWRHNEIDQEQTVEGWRYGRIYTR